MLASSYTWVFTFFFAVPPALADEVTRQEWRVNVVAIIAHVFRRDYFSLNNRSESKL
jgi:hypothetical protein